MSLARCYNCGALIDIDFEPDSWVKTDEDCNEIELDEPECSSCRDGTY